MNKLITELTLAELLNRKEQILTRLETHEISVMEYQLLSDEINRVMSTMITPVEQGIDVDKVMVLDQLLTAIESSTESILMRLIAVLDLTNADIQKVIDNANEDLTHLLESID